MSRMTGSVGSNTNDPHTLRVGVGRAYATINDAIDALSAVTWKSFAALSGTVTTTLGSASITGSGFLDMKPNCYLKIGANFEPVKSIEGDGNATLWSGARAAVTGAVADIYLTDPYRIMVYGAQTFSRDGTLPVAGLDLTVVGAPTTSPELITTRLSEGTNKRIIIPATHHGRLRFESIKVSGEHSDVDESPLFFGGFSSGAARGIHEMEDVFVQDVPACMLAGGASWEVKNSEWLDSKWHFTGDYGLFEDLLHHGDKSNRDWGFWITPLDTDIGHEVVWNRVTLQVDTPISNPGGNLGFEMNGQPLGKVVRIKNSDCRMSSVPESGDVGGHMFLCWHGGGNDGEYYFEDSIIDSLNAPHDIANESNPYKAINFSNTYRADGVSVPRVKIDNP